jgi:hypothetical protein
MARSKHPPQQPKRSARARADQAARAARLAREMRSNLLKRKAQQRAKRQKSEPK